MEAGVIKSQKEAIFVHSNEVTHSTNKCEAWKLIKRYMEAAVARGY
jgi:hypothetical protein